MISPEVEDSGDRVSRLRSRSEFPCAGSALRKTCLFVPENYLQTPVKNQFLIAVLLFVKPSNRTPTSLLDLLFHAIWPLTSIQGSDPGIESACGAEDRRANSWTATGPIRFH